MHIVTPCSLADERKSANCFPRACPYFNKGREKKPKNISRTREVSTIKGNNIQAIESSREANLLIDCKPFCSEALCLHIQCMHVKRDAKLCECRKKLEFGIWNHTNIWLVKGPSNFLHSKCIIAVAEKE